MGHRKAAVAVGHSILVICWHLLTNNCDYDDLGGDWFTRRTDTDKRRDHLIRQLHDLGCDRERSEGRHPAVETPHVMLWWALRRREGGRPIWARILSSPQLGTDRPSCCEDRCPDGIWEDPEMSAGGSTGEHVAVTQRPDGTREEVEFFPSGDSRLFGCRHVPAGPTVGGLLVCSPVLADFGANYQREVRLGRRLAAAGVVVQRYHPRGVGQSDGLGTDLTVDTMITDARAALDHLRGRYPEVTVGVLGTRLAAFAAAAVAAELVGAPVALWEPALDARRFVRDGLRARRVHQLRAGTSSDEEPEAELDRRGHLDVLGIPVGGPLFRTPPGHDVGALLGDDPRPILLVQFEARDDLRPEYQALVDRWTAAGCSVTARQCPSEETWWFVPDRLAPVGELLDVTVEWVLATLR